jgi:hypothetical protein
MVLTQCRMSLVAQGAVPITLNKNSLGERYVRTSYGLKWNIEYDPALGHTKKDRKRAWLCDYEYEVRDRIKWLIKVVSHNCTPTVYSFAEAKLTIAGR